MERWWGAPDGHRQPPKASAALENLVITGLRLAAAIGLLAGAGTI
jgi:hypothetical protein